MEKQINPTGALTPEPNTNLEPSPVQPTATVLPPAPPLTPSPAIEPTPAPITVPSIPMTSFNSSSSAFTDRSAGESGGKKGLISLILSSLAVGTIVLLIFVNSLVSSLTMTYVWFFVILILGVAGLAFGLLSEKGQEKISLLGLLGIVVSTIVCINCLILGSYYIKIQIEINNLKNKYNNYQIDTGSSSNNKCC